MFISKTYKELQRQLHEAGGYGKHGDKWAGDAKRLYEKYKCTSALDYGAGKGRLAKAMKPIKVQCYDPCVPGWDKAPSPADLVVCADVLEHVEPEYIENVLAHIRSLTKVVFFAVIATEPAVKVLSDGRNAHILLRSRNWWLDALGRHKFAVDDVTEANHKEIVAVLRPC